ncbi:TetR family transcriptional regulator [Salinibacterium sp. G-O1]|uniref:TetR/AcrR family transcriptional regulator n=1 Tax=Salinibacterium sp. G-O1 TaxID=3046208 RepID=UPI0024B97A15|nr:TetR family transcriptional regulator [Salinibacterium sp. G-O1]MDJ0336116.1 TetR family transcriptional regulator [Salinibacterium sp. G-O1]
MSTKYHETGRAGQKSRTRSALIASARELVARAGRPPTVAEAAEAASISRTTAYRYFPTQRSLLIAAHPETEATSMLPSNIGDDPEQRLEAAVRGFLAMVIDTEAQQRTMLRLSLEADATLRDLPLRQGRAIGWFTEALDPLIPQLGVDGVHKVAVGVRAVAGIEALVWLVDIAGMTKGDAVEQMVWSSIAVLRRALSESPASQVQTRRRL